MRTASQNEKYGGGEKLICEKIGKVVKGLGGLYEVRVFGSSAKEVISCRAKGSLHRDEKIILVGDNVRVTVDTDTPDGVVISEILPRKNELIRPPLSNLDYIFIVFAVKKPSPVLETVDKLTAIAHHNEIMPVIVITKADLDEELAREYAEIYRKSNFSVFVTSGESGEGTGELKKFIGENVTGSKTAAFAGASGVGKSTLMNCLFDTLTLKTSEISKKIERGRHTTRHVEIFDISECEDTGFLADTPGFSLIDFSRFDFFGVDELEAAFPDIAVYKGMCRYSDCAHLGESAAECAVAKALESGEIQPTRLESYRAIYRVLKDKKNYD